MRRVIAALIVVGLTIAVILLWPSPTAEIPPDTLAGATTTTSTTSPATTTTFPNTTTTSAVEGSHVVETVEEAEDVLRIFLYRWFSAIYEEDRALLEEIAGNPRQVDAGVAQFGVMEFASEPTLEAIVVSDLEILRSDSDCLVTWSNSGAEFRGGTSEIVHVFRWGEDSWLFMNTWLYRDDLWEADCESQLQS